MRLIDDVHINDRFGRLVVLSVVTVRKQTKSTRCAVLRCDCDNTITARLSELRSGCTRSCGCLRSEIVANRNAIHLKTGAALWETWSSMLERCARPADDRYALRGITVAAEWVEFLPFADYVLRHIGPRPYKHSLDRVDNNLGYMPGNIRWATPKEQVRNRENTRRITVNGQMEAIATVAEKTGIAPATIDARLKRGWTPERAAQAVVRKYGELITVNNKTQTVQMWAEETGISIAAIRKRIKQGWDLASAVTVSKNGRYQKK